MAELKLVLGLNPNFKTLIREYAIKRFKGNAGHHYKTENRSVVSRERIKNKMIGYCISVALIIEHVYNELSQP